MTFIYIRIRTYIYTLVIKYFLIDMCTKKQHVDYETYLDCFIKM